MAQVFRTGYGSEHDVQRVHQPVVRKLVAHLESNCLDTTVGSTARRAEMITILTDTVAKLTAVDA